MPDTPTLTVGTDTYVSLADATAYAADRLFGDAFTNATPTRQVQALRTATSLLDRLRWQGRPQAATQPLAWPRVLYNTPPGYPLVAPIPTAIEHATTEWAITLLQTNSLPGPHVKTAMLGDVMTTYFPTIADDIPRHVHRLIDPFLRAASANVAEVSF
jgi:hypothetical protein